MMLKYLIGAGDLPGAFSPQSEFFSWKKILPQ